MIPRELAITPGLLVRHDEGLLYVVEDVRINTDGYETAHKLGGRVINYMQLQDGGYPTGTKWSKSEEGFRQFFTPEGRPAGEEVEAEESNASEADDKKFYPFSLVLGSAFDVPKYAYGVALTEADQRVREKLSNLAGSSSMQGTGQLLGVLAEGKLRGRAIPEIQPHPGRGVTFNDPERLLQTWPQRQGVGPTLHRLMNNLIKNSTSPNFDK